MKSIIRNVAGIFYASALLVSTSTFAQKSFTLSPEETRQINKYVRNYEVYPVSRTTVYMLADKPIDPNLLSGSFVSLPEEYIQVRKEVKGMFAKNELTTDLKGQFNMGFAKAYPVIRNTDTDEHYFIISEDYLPTVDVIIERRSLLQNLRKAGYEEFERGGELFIKSKTAEIKLDTWTFSELKANPSYIANFDADQVKIAGLVKQTPSHSKSLEKYINLYSLRGRNMSTADINAWRTATTNAQKLQDQIYRVSKKYDGNYSYKLLDVSDTHEVFVNRLRSSKNALGM